MLIPKHLKGTPVETLLKEIEAAARARGLFVRRDWTQGQYGGIVRYSVNSGKGEVLSCVIRGTEGKTLRARSSAELQGLKQEIEAIIALIPEDCPTEVLPGCYLLQAGQREQLRAWNVVWDRDLRKWIAPVSKLAEVTELLAPRDAMFLGSLSREHEAILVSMVPEGDRHRNANFEYTVLKAHHAAVMTSFRNNDTWVGLGTDFPRSTNAELRDRVGARWSGLEWTVRIADRPAALVIIAAHRSEALRASAEKERAEEARVGIFRWSAGTGYGGAEEQPGALLYRADQDSVHRWYYVLSCTSTYYAEGGMFSGVGDDQGYLYHYVARPASEEEYSERERNRLIANARRVASAKVELALRSNSLFGPQAPGLSYPWKDGTYGLLDVTGEEVVVSPRDTHRGGNATFAGLGDRKHWFVVDTSGQYIWHMSNSRVDLDLIDTKFHDDDWSRNNVRVGGVSAVGYRFPRTPERDRVIEWARLMHTTDEESLLRSLQSASPAAGGI